MLLFGAKICVNYLNNIPKAAEYCASAVKLCNNEAKYSRYLGRSYHYLGVCYSALSPTIISIARKKLHIKALECFQLAQISQCNDYLFYFHYALEQAETRNILEATKLIKISLDLNDHFSSSWILFILLLTSQKLYNEALEICEATLIHHDDINLYYCYASLQIHFKNYEKAFQILKIMCEKSSSIEVKQESISEPSTSSLFSPRGSSSRGNDDLSEKSQISQMSQMSDNSSIKLQGF